MAGQRAARKMSDSASRLEKLKRELAELKWLMEYASQIMAQLAETGERFSATMRTYGGLVPNARVKPEGALTLSNPRPKPCALPSWTQRTK